MLPTKPYYQSDQSYNTTLLELKKRAANPHLPDPNEVRNTKATTSCLGLCGRDVELLQDGIYTRDGRHHCPHDSRSFDVRGERVHRATHTNGCYYSCRIFTQPPESLISICARILNVSLIEEAFPASDLLTNECA